MPTRLLYEKICVSVTLADLTAEEERFFFRLLVQCDDYGRFHAHPAILLGRCFPLQAEDGRVTVPQVRAWRDRLEAAGLIAIYGADGLEYLVVLTWASYQRQRASTSKFPQPPPSAANGRHPHADAGKRGEMPLAGAAAAPAEGAGGRYPVAGDGSRGPGAGTRAAAPARGNGAHAPGKSSNGSSSRKPTEEWIEPGHPDYDPIVGRIKRVRL